MTFPLFSSTTFRSNSQLPRTKEEYEKLSRSDLECFRCGQVLRNVPLLKEHLEEEWEVIKNQGSSRAVKGGV